ncbi:MAG TPA: hypothetical protein DCE42_30605, partial [Myxococcales bacterium]|nr:hypothetical protein [Myxococcales bacterium]
SRPAKRQQPTSRPTSRPVARRTTVKKRTMQPTSTETMLYGYVLERGTRKPIDGATMFFLGQRVKKQVIANEQGQYEVPKLPPGRYRLVIPVPNYKRFQAILRVYRGKKRSVKPGRDRKTKKPIIPIFAGEKQERAWYIRSEGSGLFETVTRERKERREIHRQSLRQEEIKVLPGTQGDPLKVVQNLPGVARTPLNTGFFVVRGSAPDDSRVYLNGHQIPQLYHFGGLTAVLNGDMAKRLDFIPGGFSVAYGRSTGGVIDLQTRKGKDRWHGYLDFDFTDIGLFLEGPLWKGANLIISGRRSHLDAFLGLVLPSDNRAFDLTVAPRYYDAQVKLDWQITKAQSVGIMFYFSDDRLSFLRDEPIGRSNIRGDFNFTTTFYRFQTYWKIAPSKTIEHQLSFDVGLTSTNTNAGAAITVDNANYDFSFRDELRLKPFSFLSFRMGIDTRIRRTELSLRIPNISPPRPEDEPGSGSTSSTLDEYRTIENKQWVMEPAAYFEINWKPVKPLRTITGVRVDYFSRPEQFLINPRFAVSWTVIKPLTLTGSVGLFSQPPSGQEVNPDFGNPLIKSENAIHYTAGLVGRWKCPAALGDICREFTTEFTFYYKHLYDLITSSNQVVIRDGDEVSERLNNQGVGRAYGLEVLIRFPPHKRFFGWLSYTVGRSERQDAPGKEWRLFDYDQTHIFTVLGAYKLGFGFSVSARFRLVSGNPYTPIQGSIYNADTNGYIQIPGKLYSARNPLFHQLDIRLDYELVFPLWKLSFYLDVQNVYNYPNQEGTINNYDFTQTAPLTGLPIFPSLGVKGQF